MGVRERVLTCVGRGEVVKGGSIILTKISNKDSSVTVLHVLGRLRKGLSFALEIIRVRRKVHKGRTSESRDFIRGVYQG